MHASRTIIRSLLTALAIALSVAVVAEPAATAERSLFIIVLQPLKSGEQGFDVAKHGGTLKLKHGSRLSVYLPEQAVEGVRRDPRIRYIQRVVVGAPQRGGGSPRPEMAGITAEASMSGGSLVTNGSAVWTSGPYAYDPSGNLTAVGPSTMSATDTYRYDRIGRVTTATVFDQLQTRNVSHGYDAAGNMTSVTTDNVTVALPVDTATNRLSNVTYDALGNVTRLPGWSYDTYDYDELGMLRVDARLGSSYVYTADDERIGALSGSTWRWTLRDLDKRVVREYESFGNSIDYYLDSFLWVTDHFYAGSTMVSTVRETAEGGRRHYHADHLGTPRLVTNESGRRVAMHVYLPFGIESTSIRQDRARGFEHEETQRFTGHERDGMESSNSEHTQYLDYMHARYYEPNWGRFLSVDPARRSADRREPQSWNRYAYTGNNPLKFTDPNGREKLRFELTTRIPMPTVTVPMSFGGVNRVFHGDAHGNTFRTRQTFTVETNAAKAGSNPVLAQNQVAGQTVEYNRNGSVKGTATATQVGSISGSFQNGLAVVDVKTDSANPMVSGAPAINTDFRIVATSTGEFAVGGSIDGFPSATLTVTNEQGQTFTVFDFDPRSVGNGPFSLMPGVGDQQINVACTSYGTCDWLR